MFIWLSFSRDGVNQGCCNVKASSPNEAMEICKGLGIVPEYDDIFACEMTEPELPINQLMPREYMKSGGWENEKS